MKKIKKFGFTLVEVMIALALVGVISALTIPNIGTSINEKMRLSQFKAAYSMLETALQNATSEKGAPYACYMQVGIEDDGKKYGVASFAGASNAGCAEFKKVFLKNLGVSHSCEANPTDEGCLPANYPEPDSNCSQFKPLKSKTKAYVLDNSMILIVSSSGMREFAIDVNGKKAPNKWGQDIFTFQVKSTEAAKIGNKTFVTATAIMPPSTGYCLPGHTNNPKKGDPKSSDQMWMEMVGAR